MAGLVGSGKVGSWLVLALVGVVGILFTLRQQPPSESLALEGMGEPVLGSVTAQVTPGPIKVFVSGAVQQPGVYTLAADSRVVDALAAAGGVTEEAAWEALNQAAPLTDGMQIHMPLQGTLPPAVPEAAVGSGAFGGHTGDLIPINRADAATLESLPGIGPALAGRIIEYRAAHGPFSRIEELTQVPGIGERLLEKIRDRLTLH